MNVNTSPATESLREQHSNMEALIGQGRFNEAEAACENLMAEFPGKSHGFIGSAKIAFKQNDIPLTLERCEKYLQKFPHELALLNFKAESLVALQRVEEAKKIFQLICEIYPEKATGFIGLTRLEFKLRNYQGALDLCNQSLPRFPTELVLNRFKIESLIILERYSEAEQACENLIAQHPDIPELYIALCRIAFKQKDFQLCLSRCRTYTARFPDDFQILNFQGESLTALSKYPEAEEIASRLKSDFPGKPAASLILARIAQYREQHEQTVEHCYQILRQFPQEGTAINLITKSLIALSKTEEARKLCEQFMAGQPENPVAYLGLARIALAQTKFEEAIEICNKAIALCPEESEIISIKGSAFIALSRMQEAQALYDDFVAKFPQNPSAHIGLHQLHKRLEQHSTALAAIEKAYTLQPKILYIVHQYAMQLELMGRKDDAFRLLENHVNNLAHDACIVPLVNLYSKYGDSEKILELLDAHKDSIRQYPFLQPKVGLAQKNKGNLEAAYIIFQNFLNTELDDTFYKQKQKFKVYEQINWLFNVVRDQRYFRHAFFSRLNITKPGLFHDSVCNALFTLVESQQFADYDSLAKACDLANINPVEYSFVDLAYEYAKKLSFIADHYAGVYLDSDISPHSAISLARELVERIRQKLPTSVIRLGDGEGMYLDYPALYREWQHTDKEYSQRVWWGDVKFSPTDYSRIETFFHDAVQQADILGIPNLAALLQGSPNAERQTYHPTHRGWQAILYHLSSPEFLAKKNPKAILTCCVYNNDFDLWGLWRYVLIGLSHVTVITCHTDIAQVMRDKFGIPSVRVIPIPSEHRHSFNFDSQNGLNDHYPTHFEMLMDGLQPEEGEVILVAAGFLGKIYCNEIKKRGGIGIDVGSIADAWMGYVTRGVQEYKCPPAHVHIDLDALRAQSFPGYRKVKDTAFYRSNYYCDLNIYESSIDGAPKVEQHKSLLITGHPRCGSMYMSLLLKQFGVDINHEYFGQDGICSWLYAVKDMNIPCFSREDNDTKDSYRTEFRYTIAYIRNPFDAIPSIILENRGQRSYNFRRNHLIRSLDIDLDDFKNELERAVASFVYWYKLVDALRPDAVFKVEDCVDDVRAFLQDHHLATNPSFESNQVTDVAHNANSTLGLGYVKPVIAPQYYRNLPKTLLDALDDFCQRHGYRIPY